MYFWNKFCGIIAIFLISGISSYGQNSVEPLSAKNNSLLKATFFETNDIRKFILSDTTFISFHNRAFVNKSKKPSDYFPYTLSETPSIPADFSTCQYGFFCRQELRIEKATKIPLRIRLGSLEQCNYYEGKP